MKKLLIGPIVAFVITALAFAGSPEVAEAACADLPTDKGRALITKNEDSNLKDLAQGQYHVWSRVKHADGKPSYIISIDGNGGDFCQKKVADTNGNNAGQWEWVKLGETLSWSGGEVKVQMGGDKSQTGLDCVVLNPSASFAPKTKEDCNPVGNDKSPPQIPSGFSATADGTKVSLKWQSASDDVGVKEYRVYRKQNDDNWQSSPVATPTGLAYTDSSVTSGNKYTYRIKTVDFAGNESQFSSEKTVNVGGGAGDVQACQKHDVNQDKAVSIIDTSLVVRNHPFFIGGNTLNSRADVTDDGRVSTLDISRVVSHIKICRGINW